MKKLFSALVIAGFLAGLGCGGDTSTTKEKGTKDKATTTTPPKGDKGGMPDKKDKDKE